MKKINSYIQEKLRINQDTKVLKQEYTCQPKDWDELRSILKERLEKDKNANLNDIDVSKIEDLHSIFFDLNPHDIKIDKWNVSKVKNMNYMFGYCENFNADLSEWDVSNVEYMWRMFYGCVNFEGKGLENWDVSKVEDMYNMFDNCDSLKNKPSWYKE